MQPNAKQAIKKMIWHYEYELLCATNSSDKEKFAEKIIEWSGRLEDKPNRAEEKTIRAIQENIINPMIK
jgi:hypothetical protein